MKARRRAFLLALVVIVVLVIIAIYLFITFGIPYIFEPAEGS